MTSLVLDDVVTSFSERISSHRSAWPRMQACMISDATERDVYPAFGNANAVFDNNTWLISTPMEFKGQVFNLFGGFTQEVRNRIERLLDMDPQNIKALDIAPPRIGDLLGDRAAKSGLDFSKTQWDKINDVSMCEVISHEDFVLDPQRVVIGDSHSIARYRRNSIVYRHDGLTLHRLTQNGVRSYLPSFPVKHLVIVAGNIDIRHHIMRQDDPNISIIKLAKDLHDQLENLKLEGLIESYEITSPYPIEFEGRRIPKTGWYKGSAFAGSRDQRDKIRQTFQSYLNLNVENVFHWPTHWYMMDPEEYAKTYMEKPGSVHLSPEFYEWDLAENQENKWQN